jgi:hypothetical protein
MRRIFYFLIGFIIGISAYSQSLQGFYTGQMKVQGQRDRMQVQLDLIEEDGGYRGVFRSRFVENNSITGCDNWVEGRMIGKNLVLRNLAATRATGIDVAACNYLNQIRLTFNEKKETPEFSCVWENQDDIVFGRFFLTRIDTAVSYTVEEEREIAYRKIAETMIFRSRNDSIRIGLMLQYRPLAIRDTISVPPGDVEIQITAPDADPFHLFSVLINTNPVAIKRAPKQQGLKILLKTTELENAEIKFLCEHALVDVDFDVQVVIIWSDKRESLVVPVSTLMNSGFLLHVEQPKDGGFSNH